MKEIRESKVYCIWLSSLALPTGQGGPITTEGGIDAAVSLAVTLDTLDTLALVTSCQCDS